MPFSIKQADLWFDFESSHGGGEKKVHHTGLRILLGWVLAPDQKQWNASFFSTLLHGLG